MSPSTPPSHLLDNSHCDILFRAVRNVLATDIAVATLAQILGGLPTRRVYYDNYHASGIVPHPVVGHDQVCPSAEDKAKNLRAEFDPAILRFSSSLLEAFQDSTQSSLAFDLRLIELVAVSLHQIAVFLHRRKEHLHDPATTGGVDVEETTLYHPPPLANGFQYRAPQPTMFCHPDFTNWKKYPSGVDDMAGYWAENRILGGVVLFKRSSKPSEKDPERNVYFQCSRHIVTFRVCQLLDKQQNGLISFLTSRDPSALTCPLPILPGKENGNRCDPDEAIPVYDIYRDIWERTPPEPAKPNPTWIILSRCGGGTTKNSFDYPELEEKELRMKAILDRLWEQTQKDGKMARGHQTGQNKQGEQDEQDEAEDKNNVSKADTATPREYGTVEQGKNQNDETVESARSQKVARRTTGKVTEVNKQRDEEEEYTEGTDSHDLPKEELQKEARKLGEMTSRWREKLSPNCCLLM